jgi:ABC-type Fe3+-citrate transport system substrate-binding protein
MLLVKLVPYLIYYFEKEYVSAIKYKFKENYNKAMAMVNHVNQNVVHSRESYACQFNSMLGIQYNDIFSFS